MQQNLTGNHEEITAIAIQSDGKIIGVGDSSDTQAHQHNTIVRLTTAGKLDTSFQSAGVRIFGSIDHQLTGVAINSSGQIFVVSNYNQSNGVADPKITITRLKSDGSTDTSYGSGGSG